ncbi:MAG: CheR family methyltransferase [Promethearchaeota archaeon]
MQDNFEKFQIFLESDEGLEDLINFIRQKRLIEISQDEDYLKEKLLVAKRKMGFKNYSELLDHIENNQNSSAILFALLEKDFQTHSPQIPLRKQSKTIKEYMNPSTKKQKKKKKNKFNLKKIQEVFKVEEPTDLQHLPLIMDFLSKKKINYQSYKEKYFLRRLHIRMRKVKTPSYSLYRNFLEKNPNELTSLVDCLSVNVTRFFRDKELFEVLDKEILPILLTNTGQVRIWSAGCAIGPEPYSIAIMMKRVCKKLDKINNIHILATDISQDFLTQAKEGKYSKEYFDEMNPLEIQSFFHPLKNNNYELSPQIRNLVTFKKHDLRTPPPSKDFDLILCRNVLIYFSKPQSISLFQRFHSTLKTHGYLVLGKCELLPTEVKDKFEIIDAHNRIYQRRD